MLLLAAVGLIAPIMPIASAAAAGPSSLPGRPVTGEYAGQVTVDQMKALEPLGPAASATAPRQPPPLPGRGNLPQAPGSQKLKATPQPKAASGVGPRNPQATGTKLLGATYADGGLVPPDSMGAVGPTQFIVFVNNRVRSFDKATGMADSVLNAAPDAFFATVRNSGDSTSDPHIRYDRLSGRWFVSIITVPMAGNPMSTHTNNRVAFAVSSGSTITGGTTWTLSYFTVSTGHNNCIWDYDTLGIDSNALYVGGNLFCGTTNPLPFSQSDGLVLRKNALVGGTVVGKDFLLATNPPPGPPSCPNDGPFTPQGVDSYDGSSVGYFVGTSICYFAELAIIKITDPGGTAAAFRFLLSVPSTYVPNTFGVPVLGTTATNGVDALDDRLFAAHLRSGHLWTAHNLRVNSSGVSQLSSDRAAARWYDLTNLDTTPIVNQVGTVFDGTASATNYWIPSIMVSGQGHAAMGMSVASATEHAEAAAVGRLAGDGLSTMQTPTVYQTTSATYNLDTANPHRWGDYSYTSLDPNDDMTMWTIQEFADANDSWGVEAVQLKAPPPATPTTPGGGPFYASTPSQTLQVTGAAVFGSGFFDPGPAFPSHIQASMSGGAVVNSVTYIDPTHITVNFSTDATTGMKDLTITNPDGQSITATGFVNTVAAPALPSTVQAVSHQQYTLTNNNGTTWQEISVALRISTTPGSNLSTLLTANADLFTSAAGFNQDIGIFVSDNGGPDQILAWKESGGFAGTFSPNAAYVQALFNMTSGHAYIFKVEWKTNKDATGTGATIWAGAGSGPQYSPTSLIAKIFPAGVVPAFSVINAQQTLNNSNGTTWMPLGGPVTATLMPASDSIAVLGANVDLWTGNAGYNQDIAIFISDNGGADTLVAWKESGGFAGTFSPNAAFVKGTSPMTAGHTYAFKLMWKTNKNAPGVTIAAAAGAGPLYSPTSLYAETVVKNANPYIATLRSAQPTLPNSDGSSWIPMAYVPNLSISPATGAPLVILGANSDLWTGNAGFNQDIAIFVSDNGVLNPVPLTWKESGGFAGTFSPNAAMAQALYQMTAGHTYVFTVRWKTNVNAPGATIASGAGSGAPFSPTTLSAELTGP